MRGVNLVTSGPSEFDPRDLLENRCQLRTICGLALEHLELVVDALQWSILMLSLDLFDKMFRRSIEKSLRSVHPVEIAC